MKVVVLGAGIAGVTAAWYLAAAGAEVTVIERGAEPACETSHANGGHISTQSGVPWTGPAGLREFFTSRYAAERPIRVLHTHDPGRMRWFALGLKASRPGAYRQAAQTLGRLARFSRDCFDRLVSEQNLDVCLESRGVLAVYRTRAAFKRARARERGGAAELSPREILDQEPALAQAVVKPVGALYYPDDSTGDCLRFCSQLAAHAMQAGAEFRYGERARRLLLDHGACRGVATDRDELRADACVVALGVSSTPFMRIHGIRLPILALRGYTLTAPIGHGTAVPGRISDVERHIVCARLGTRFRAAGIADFTGPVARPDWRREQQLERLVREWYPGLSRNETEHWSCLRPITPDGPPILGASGIPAVWLNTGLGPLGWTLGCGAGRIVSDLVLGREPAIPLAGLTRERFR